MARENNPEDGIGGDGEEEAGLSKKGSVTDADADAAEGRTMINNNLARKNKAEKRRARTGKDGGPNLRGRKSGKKGVLYQEKHQGEASAARNPASPLAAFFGSFERRRRLLVSIPVCFRLLSLEQGVFEGFTSG